MTTSFKPSDYLEVCAEILARSVKFMPLPSTWPHIRDGLLPTLSPDDRCEAVIPTNFEVGGLGQSTANEKKVKPAGTVDFALAHIFQDRLVFLTWSGTFRLKYALTTVRYADVQSVNPVEFRYRGNVMPGFEILGSSGRIPVLGNDPYKFDRDMAARWNNRLMKRLTGAWEPRWVDGEPRVKEWGAPA